MKNIKKALLLSGITVGLFFGVSNVHAETAKVWTDSTPKIKVKSESKCFDFNARVSLDKTSKMGSSTFDPSFNGNLSKQGLSYLLHHINVRKGQTLTFKTFEITDVNGNVLPNCNMIDNTLFVAGAPHVKINVGKDGCTVK